MSDFLKTRGIDDLNNINFEGDNGEIVQRSWNDLSNEEKINILNMPLEEQHEDNNGLTDEEIALLSQIRQSNLSPSEYLQQIAGDTVEVTPQYKIYRARTWPIHCLLWRTFPESPLTVRHLTNCNRIRCTILPSESQKNYHSQYFPEPIAPVRFLLHHRYPLSFPLFHSSFACSGFSATPNPSASIRPRK